LICQSGNFFSIGKASFRWGFRLYHLQMLNAEEAAKTLFNPDLTLSLSYRITGAGIQTYSNITGDGSMDKLGFGACLADDMGLGKTIPTAPSVSGKTRM